MLCPVTIVLTVITRRYNPLEICEFTAWCCQSQLAVCMCKRLAIPSKVIRTMRISVEKVDVACQIRCKNSTLRCVSMVPVCTVADVTCQADESNRDLCELKIIRQNETSL